MSKFKKGGIPQLRERVRNDNSLVFLQAGQPVRNSALTNLSGMDETNQCVMA